MSDKKILTDAEIQTIRDNLPKRRQRRPVRPVVTESVELTDYEGTNYYYPEDKETVIAILKDLLYALEVSNVGIETALASNFNTDNTTAFTIVLTQSGLVTIG